MPTPVPLILNNRTWDESHLIGADGYAYARPREGDTAPALIGLAYDVVQHSLNLFSSTASDTETLSTGLKTLTIEQGKGWLPDQPARLVALTDSSVRMDGEIQSYNPQAATNNLQFLVQSHTGTPGAVYTGWRLVMLAAVAGGTTGEISLPLSIGQGGTGGTTRATARTNLRAASTEGPNTFVNTQTFTGLVTGSSSFVGQEFRALAFGLRLRGPADEPKWVFNYISGADSRLGFYWWNAATGSHKLVAMVDTFGNFLGGDNAQRVFLHTHNGGHGTLFNADLLDGRHKVDIQNFVIWTGSHMVFHNEYPPAGWTKWTGTGGVHDCVMIMTEGTVRVDGGDSAIWSLSQTRVGGHAINQAQMPSHGHTTQPHTHAVYRRLNPPNTVITSIAALEGTLAQGNWQFGYVDAVQVGVNPTGGNQPHDHAVTLNPRKIYVILGQRTSTVD